MQSQSSAPKRWWSTRPSDTPGVYRRHRKWQARIYFGGRFLHLGCYATEREAIRARRAAEERKAAGLPVRDGPAAAAA